MARTTTAISAGAAALITTMHGLASERDALRDVDSETPTAHLDWRPIVAHLEASLDANLHQGSAELREGYLRALADLMLTVGDGLMPTEKWDAEAVVTNTAGGFDRLPLR